MAKSAPMTFSVVFGRAQPERDRTAELSAAEEVTAGERQWLDARVNADGTIDEYEQALIAFLAAAAG